ncbi:MAG: nucleotidyltransferase domain-containing protein [Spirochaetes bacterium]|nr:nucleotidyltransferase domain-containing protein [Spirochaetota bacterium]
MSIDPTLPDDLKRDISLAAEILLREGCKEVYVFGSVARGTYTPESDIDIATIGLPKSKFFSAYGLLLSKLHRQVDLAGLDYDQDFGRSLRAEGSLTRVA